MGNRAKHVQVLPALLLRLQSAACLREVELEPREVELPAQHRELSWARKISRSRHRIFLCYLCFFKKLIRTMNVTCNEIEAQSDVELFRCGSISCFKVVSYWVGNTKLLLSFKVKLHLFRIAYSRILRWRKQKTFGGRSASAFPLSSPCTHWIWGLNRL